MERLTAIENGYAYYPKCFEEPCDGNGCTNDECEMRQQICEKLAKYEDTRLEPEICAEYKKFEDECVGKNVTFANILKIIERLRTGGWIPVTEKLPDVPEPNPIFDDKPLELYWVSEENSDYAFRAFWNGQYFTDGFSRADVVAWQPLPEPYKPEVQE